MSASSKFAKRLAVPMTSVAAAALLLVACGGGDSSVAPAPIPPPAPTVLSGVAASGAPLAGATVTVVDSDAATVDPAAHVSKGIGKKLNIRLPSDFSS